ncbi:hypothetical protein KI688_008763 [Linnemannia hyalina]|uniref:Uncharacterized protein n=1 Tax=Linnemannia hyalina TaxID=64524 RepID=A0A9P7Y3N7_9FUNG|nr:hypothetical protein KI688_008763 [Linnemannia hyalina]
MRTPDEATASTRAFLIKLIHYSHLNPKVSYSSRGYVFRGSIKTDGYRIQLLAFKLRELSCVKYQRLREDKRPDSLISTLGCTDHYLTEIRNVVKTTEDVNRIWNCDPNDIKFLGIDLGQVFVVGASAILPSSASVTSTDEEKQGAITEIDIPMSTQLHNLAVSQKAIYQPTFKHRRWLEQRKGRAVEGTESIAHKETNLPPLRGPEASITEHVKRPRVVESDLHQWDAKRARDQEFKLVGKRHLELVGGTPGAKRDGKNKVIIGVGLGEFSSSSRLSSLHTAFLKYFVQLARSLDYIIVGVNEYSTSKRCLVCLEFVAKDVMAAHNMCNIIQGHLLDDKNGVYIWEMEENTQSVESM